MFETSDTPKTIAAFANNQGGYFVFGVENKTWKLMEISLAYDFLIRGKLPIDNVTPKNPLRREENGVAMSDCFSTTFGQHFS